MIIKKGSAALKPVLDAALALALVATLGWHLSGNLWHEYIAAVFLSGVLWHLYLNFAALRQLLPPWRSPRPAVILRRVLNLLLLLNILALLLSGITLSRHLFDFLQLPRQSWAQPVHQAAAAAWFILLSGAHLGLNASFIGSKLISVRLQDLGKKHLQKLRLLAFSLAL